MKYFWILNDIFSNGDDLPVGPRIKTMNLIGITVSYESGDGPYISLKELRKNSVIFKKLNRTNPTRAQKIQEKRFIIQTDEIVGIRNSTQKNLGNAAYEILEHSVSGKIKNGEVTGVHIFNQKLHKIDKLITSPNLHGIWEANISIKNSKNGAWIKKNSSTTFFPDKWTKSLLLLKLEEAFLTKIKFSEEKFIGMTDCGIEVVFIIKNGVVKFVYTILVK